MADVATVWDPAGSRGDWALAGASLATGTDGVTAALISIFTDAAATPEELILAGMDPTSDPRGWWGDLGADRPIGSKLWLLQRAKQTEETLELARQSLVDCLQWMIDDGVASAVDVELVWTQRGRLSGVVRIARPGGGSDTVRFADAWRGV